MQRPSFTIGIEEEYLVVDAATWDVVPDPGEAFFATCRDRLGERIAPEFLRCQIEVGTEPHATIGGAIAELAGLRRGVAEAAAAHGYRVIAASSHPFARWRGQRHTARARYDRLAHDLGAPIRRMLISAMHVHAGIEDAETRIDLMNRITPFLPLFLALSGSSPYWQGEDTRASSFRLTIFDSLPRTGLPERLDGDAAWRDLVGALGALGCVEDGTKIWWDARPSARYPTLELRITDICPRLADTAAIAALYQALLARLWRAQKEGDAPRLPARMLIAENRWLAQRHGSGARLLDPEARERRPLRDLVEGLTDWVAPEAEALGCRADLARVREIAACGTSAVRQRAVFAASRAAGASRQEALRAVVAMLARTFEAPA